MENLIRVDKQVAKLNDKGIQTWITPQGGLRFTQRIQLGEAYAIMRLSDEVWSYTAAYTAEKSDLLRIIEDNEWNEIPDAMVCRESDVKELLE